MTTKFPIVFDTEASGAVTAYVVGLPVYAAADTLRETERAIRDTLVAYLAEHPEAVTGAHIRVASVERRVRSAPAIRLVGPGALVAAYSSTAKARAARANGRKGGRPRKEAR